VILNDREYSSQENQRKKMANWARSDGCLSSRWRDVFNVLNKASGDSVLITGQRKTVCEMLRHIKHCDTQWTCPPLSMERGVALSLSRLYRCNTVAEPVIPGAQNAHNVSCEHLYRLTSKPLQCTPDGVQMETMSVG